MYTDLLKKFVENNRPAEILWDEKTVRDLAQKAGLRFEEPENYVGREKSQNNSGEILIAVWGEVSKEPKRIKKAGILGERWVDSKKEFMRNFDSATIKLPVKVRWYEQIMDREVRYTPEIIGVSAVSARGACKDPLKLLLEAAGIKEIEVDFPEEAVVLPTPRWITPRTSFSDPWETPGNETIVCFKSEVEGLIRSFINELEALK